MKTNVNKPQPHGQRLLEAAGTVASVSPESSRELEDGERLGPARFQNKEASRTRSNVSAVRETTALWPLQRW